MAEILFISKPLAPPWNDSSKNLAWSLATNMRRHRPWLMTYRDSGHAPQFEDAVRLGERVRWLPVYPESSTGFALGGLEKLAVMTTLARPPKVSCWHFFFAPGLGSTLVGSVARKFAGVPAIHTVCSAPARDKRLLRTLRAQCIVTLSRHTEALMRDIGFSEDRLVRIDPSIPELAMPSDEERRATRIKWNLPLDAPVLIYPGDLEFSAGSTISVRALADLRGHDDACLVLACRQKTDRAMPARRALERVIQALGVENRVVWAGETADIHPLLAASDLVLFPSETLHAKMDYPLVVLEAMSLARPVIVAKGTPCQELAVELSGVTAGDPVREQISALTQEIIDNAEHREGLGRLARDYALERFSESRMALAYETLYDRFL